MFRSYLGGGREHVADGEQLKGQHYSGVRIAVLVD